jgi:predicted nucleic acid-binding protein
MLEAFGGQQITFLVPDLFWVELGNALWKLVRKGRIASSQAVSALSAVRNLEIPTVPGLELVPQALQIAIRHDRTVYDCLYVALATTTANEFVTADERLANALAAYFPVKWLGAF